MAGGTTRVRLSGFQDVGRTLREHLPKATGKNVLRRTARQALEPMRATAEARAPRRFGDLVRSITIGTRVAGGSRAVHVGGGRIRAASKAGVSMHMGPGRHPQAITQEFGTFKEPAQPYMRPAWDAHHQEALDIIATNLWSNIKAAVERRARRAARGSAAA